MKTETLNPIPIGDNPFRYDLYHMGTRIGSNCIIMKPNHNDKFCPYLIICDIQTGERLRVYLTEDVDRTRASADLMQAILEDRERLQGHDPCEEES